MNGTIRSARVALVLSLAALFPAHVAQAEPRVALVIGNSNYGGDLRALPTTINDARLMAETLKKAGFNVIEVEDADRAGMRRAFAKFGDTLAAAGSGSTGLFFYAGHGVQVASHDYLVPLGANIRREADVDIEAVQVESVRDQMLFADSAVNIVILDASRDNPLNRSFRAMTRGFAEISTKSAGTFIGYSTAPGDVAIDGHGEHSPYVTALSSTILTPGLNILDAFQAVRIKVLNATEHLQVTWDSSSLIAPFYFIPPKSGQ